MTAVIFSGLGVLAIVGGGLLSAFSARRPTRETAWLSAYLVLVVGIMQVGLIDGWHRLEQPMPMIAAVAFLLYNLGNGSVILGTILKARIRHNAALVNLGGLFIALAMVFLLFAVKDSPVSAALVEFIIVVLIILISMPIGLMLSSRRRQKSRS